MLLRASIFITLFVLHLSCKKETTSGTNVDLGSGTWRISYYWDQADKTYNYTNYYFMFLSGGTLMAHGSSSTITGTWNQTDSRINITFSNPAVSDLNGNWLKTELTNSSIKLKNDSPTQDDQLHFVKN